MERTLKEVRALSESQRAAEKYGDEPYGGLIWALIALHQAVDRLVDVINDLPEAIKENRDQ